MRAVALAVTAVMLAVALGGWAVGWRTLPVALPAGVLLLGLLFERYVYKPIRTERPGPGWEQTSERFMDPRSGQTVSVYYHPRTGERRYVGEG